MPRLDIIIACWGAWHITALHGKSLPTLLHESNLPAVAAMLDLRFLIYTRGEDEVRLTVAKDALSRFGAVRIQNADMPRGYKDAWSYGLAQAAHRGALAMLVAPDIVWSIGSFRHIAELIKGGVRTIFMPHPRGTYEAFDGEPRTGAQLMAKVAEDRHPVNVSEEATAPRFTMHPELVLWPIAGGWICRMIAREPLLMDPAHATLNGNGLPTGKYDCDAFYVIESSDDACGVSLAPRDREAHHYNASHHPFNLQAMKSFARHHRNAMSHDLWSRTSLLRYGEINGDERDRVEKDVRRLMAAMANYGDNTAWKDASLRAARAWR